MPDAAALLPAARSTTLTLTGTEVQVQRAVNVWESEVTVLVPMVVVDELDRLKESKDRQTRWRARYALAVLDRLFADGPGRARLRKGMSGGAVWLATPGWSPRRHRLARTSPLVAAQVPAFLAEVVTRPVVRARWRR